jgi:hypothetical protein
MATGICLKAGLITDLRKLNVAAGAPLLGIPGFFRPQMQIERVNTVNT